MTLQEFAGTLLGFDDYVNMVLEDVTEFDYSGSPTKLSKILLNGNNICMVRAMLRHAFRMTTNRDPSSSPEAKARIVLKRSLYKLRTRLIWMIVDNAGTTSKRCVTLIKSTKGHEHRLGQVCDLAFKIV